MFITLQTVVQELFVQFSGILPNEVIWFHYRLRNGIKFSKVLELPEVCTLTYLEMKFEKIHFYFSITEPQTFKHTSS